MLEVIDYIRQCLDTDLRITVLAGVPWFLFTLDLMRDMIYMHRAMVDACIYFLAKYFNDRSRLKTPIMHCVVDGILLSSFATFTKSFIVNFGYIGVLHVFVMGEKINALPTNIIGWMMNMAMWIYLGALIYYLRLYYTLQKKMTYEKAVFLSSALFSSIEKGEKK